MKEYRLSIIVLLFLAIIVVFSTNSSKVKSADSDNHDSFSFMTVSVNEEKSENLLDQHYDIDIPLPLKDVSEQILYRKGYIVSYNKDTKLPNWVAWHLTAQHVNGEAKRPGNAWHEDTDVPTPRVNSFDYKGSGWTRGHMCPAGDNKWDSDAMYETFLYTNCCPQNANLNTGTWNQIEISCRRWAEKYGEIHIVCGPILFRQEHETIGDNKVVVPEAFFKVIVCLTDNNAKGISFICRNTDGNRKKDLYVNSIKQVERVTGMTFFPHLPYELLDSVKNSANIDDW
jgi:endonuclease G